jgi:hypothetical protein
MPSFMLACGCFQGALPEGMPQIEAVPIYFDYVHQLPDQALLAHRAKARSRNCRKAVTEFLCKWVGLSAEHNSLLGLG